MATTASNLTMTAETTAPVASEHTPKAKYSVRVQIARRILFYHLFLIFISFVYFLLRGFDGDEFTSLMGLLAPVTALYGGAVFRFIGRSITDPKPVDENGNGMAETGLVKVLVHGHFIIMLLLISAKALAPNILNFQQMTLGMTLLEAGVGAYMGSVLLALFEGKTK